MIGHPANFDCCHFMLPRDPAEIGPQPFLKARRDHRAAFFGAKDTMVVRTDVGHARIQPSHRDLGDLEIVEPNLKRPRYYRASLRDGIGRQSAAISYRMYHMESDKMKHASSRLAA